ncbi:CsbD family protein [Furfurilactobacillus sp. WILCCON 0119]|uniref:CsbD family protein n=1 Tax=Furfurilactobacillus entadae TaxID=2922307 RepID=UPI0035EBCF87
MKNILLGISLAANVAFLYSLLQDDNRMKEIQSSLDNLSDQAEGKVKQVKGALTGDTGDKISGNVEEGIGKLKEDLN